MRMCGSCEDERTKLRARIAELEAKLAQYEETSEVASALGTSRPLFSIGQAVRVLPRSAGDRLIGKGVVHYTNWENGAWNYGVYLDTVSHPVWVLGRELTHL